MTGYLVSLPFLMRPETLFFTVPDNPFFIVQENRPFYGVGKSSFLTIQASMSLSVNPLIFRPLLPYQKALIR